MTSSQPRVNAFLQREHVAHDARWVLFAEELEAENVRFRAALLEARAQFKAIIDGARHPDIALRRVLLDLKPIRAAVVRIDKTLS